MRIRPQQLLQPVREFGPCLKYVLEKKNTSASELARRMAYKSRNSIFRILEGDGGHSARQAFFGRLVDENPLGLEEEDLEELAQALEVSRVGLRTFFSNRAIRELLANAGVEESWQEMQFSGLDAGHAKHFGRVMEEMLRARQISVYVTDCCDRTVFLAIRGVVSEMNPDCRIDIRHFIYVGPEEIVHNISAIQPMLYNDCYTAYGVNPGVFSWERESLYRSNSIYIHFENEQGKWKAVLLRLVDTNTFTVFSVSDCGKENPYDAVFSRDIPRLPLLKQTFDRVSSAENYIRYTDDCRRLEHNRLIYMIKQDVPLSCIHPDILRPLVIEAFGKENGSEALINELCRIHLVRWENMFTKQKPTYTIFSAEAMERFARTGMLSDHFFAFRAFCPAERKAVLTHLRRQAQENPQFKVFFFRDDCAPPVMEIGLYEGAGTLLAKPYTHYDLSGDHAEAFITQEEFCARYKECFVNDLMEKQTLDEKETLRILDELIRCAENA